jgi:hypothetical protein
VISTSKISAWLRRAMFENFSLKLISLLCAVGFFVFIHGAERAQRVFPVPVVVVNPPDALNRQLMKTPPTEIAVTLAGPRTQIDQLSAADIGSVQLNLESGNETSIVIQQSMFNVPPGVTVEQIFPMRIDLKWEDIVVKRLPVQVARAGNPAAGYAIQGGIFVKPDTVEARGPRSTLELMQVVVAASYDVSDLVEGRQERTLVLNPPPDYVTFDVDAVTASVDIVREEQTATFGPLKVEIVGNTRATCKPTTVAVEVRGTPEVIAALRASKGEMIVPRVELPKDIDLSQPSSMMVDVVAEITGATLRVEPSKVLVKW